MRQQGRITEWNDDRGFGFITPLDGGPRVFVHISEFPRDKRRPMTFDLVAYDVDKDDRGRLRGTKVLYVALTRSARSASRSTSTGGRQFPIALAVSVLLVGMFIAASMYLGPRFVDNNLIDSNASPSTDQSITSAFQNHVSGVQMVGEGVVERVLQDDNDGSRHQRFILRLASGQTLLVAHNIDLARDSVPCRQAIESSSTECTNGMQRVALFIGLIATRMANILMVGLSTMA